ncbi:MAG TPA: aminopeptidase [Ktedonobacterales bacterium]
MLDRYADLLVRVGVNLQPGQALVIGQPGMSTVEIADFVRRLARKGWGAGASDVHVPWGDGEISRLRLQYASDEVLTSVPPWVVQQLTQLADEGAAFLVPATQDPGLFDGVDPTRLSASRKASSVATQHFREKLERGQIAWSIGAVPTLEWARQVFPELDGAQALQRLWSYIFQVMRLDTPDSVASWKAHVADLTARMNALNVAHFTRLHYRAPGTDLTIALPRRHVWLGGGETSERGVYFLPNMPTEEVFTLPQRDGVNGVVRATLPLTVGGVLIEDFSLRFERGRIVDFSAATGYDVLKSVIETDDGSHYLGEVALVPQSSPCNIGRPLFHTLLDENAACHLAIGMAYPISLEGGGAMTAEQLAAEGANASHAHVDFMVGSAQLDIDGETTSGERVAVMRGGMWASTSGTP